MRDSTTQLIRDPITGELELIEVKKPNEYNPGGSSNQKSDTEYKQASEFKLEKKEASKKSGKEKSEAE